MKMNILILRNLSTNSFQFSGSTSQDEDLIEDQTYEDEFLWRILEDQKKEDAIRDYNYNYNYDHDYDYEDNMIIF